MATVRLWTDEDVARDARVAAVFAEIRSVRRSEFVNHFWRGLANQPALLERTWAALKEIMIAAGELDPLTRELIYIAVSTVNGCAYCVHSHTAAARAKGMTDGQHGELLAVVGMAMQTNALATAMGVEADPEFEVG